MHKVSLLTIRLKEKLTTRKALIKQKTQITNSLNILCATRGEQMPFKGLTRKKVLV